MKTNSNKNKATIFLPPIHYQLTLQIYRWMFLVCEHTIFAAIWKMKVIAGYNLASPYLPPNDSATWVWITRSLSLCMTLGTFFTLSGPFFPYRKNNNLYLVDEVLLKTKQVNRNKVLRTVLSCFKIIHWFLFLFSEKSDK